MRLKLHRPEHTYTKVRGTTRTRLTQGKGQLFFPRWVVRSRSKGKLTSWLLPQLGLVWPKGWSTVGHGEW